jgi:hypothetical protein
VRNLKNHGKNGFQPVPCIAGSERTRNTHSSQYYQSDVGSKDAVPGGMSQVNDVLSGA